jgi:hypothetical protein
VSITEAQRTANLPNSPEEYLGGGEGLYFFVGGAGDEECNEGLTDVLVVTQVSHTLTGGGSGLQCPLLLQSMPERQGGTVVADAGAGLRR